MTYQEALKEFKDSLESGHALMPSHEAWLKAVEAIEKHIPKKPRIEETMTAGSMYVCECGHWLKEVSPLRYKPKFCSHCGQAIDWSKEE